MAFVDSLLAAMERANGDALVMHVGERPYVVAEAGNVDLSTQALNLGAMSGMLTQLLPDEAQAALQEFGAVEHQLPSRDGYRFTLVVARGGDDIWIEIRRRRDRDAPEASAPLPVGPEPVMDAAAEPWPSAVDPTVAAVAPMPPVVAEFPAPMVVEPPAEVDVPLPVIAASAVPIVVEPEQVAARLISELEAILEATPEAAEADVEWAAEDIPLTLAAEVADEAPMLRVVPAYAEAPEPADEAALFAIEEPMEADEPGPLATVLPMIRTGRMEAPPRVPLARMAGVERLLRIAAARGASSLIMATGSRPYLRLEGDIRLLETEPVQSKADIEAAVLELGLEGAREPAGPAPGEWIVELPEVGRVRCTTSVDQRGPGVVFTLIATRAPTADQLGLSREVQALATEAEGLVLVSGSRGSGKSTLMSALIDLVNRRRAGYVITLERQIRLIHVNRLALVSQREIRGGVAEVLAAAHAALRENPDVLVVEDLNAAQMVPLLLEAAGQGRLVFASITAPSTTDAVTRLIELAPPESRTAVQAALAETFRGAVAQLLLKKTGGGQVAAREVLLGTAAVTRLIADGQVAQLPAALESGRKHGMMPITDSLVGLVQAGLVDVREAFRKTHDRERLLAGLKRQGIDTSAVERLA